MNNDKKLLDENNLNKEVRVIGRSTESAEICDREPTKYEFVLETESPSGWGKRHSQILLGSGCVCLAFVIKSNITLALVAMTNLKYNNQSEELHWDKKIQSRVLSAFFFGYFIMMIPSGTLAQRFGGKIPITASLGICSLLSFIFPIVTKAGGWFAASACRFVQGLVISAILPGIHNIIGKWTPRVERGRATACVHTGGQIGKIIIMAISGYLSTSSVGWPLIFYVSGLLTATGCVLMWWLGVESPSRHSTITHNELDYIKRTSGSSYGQKKLKTPWKNLFTSIPLWAIIISHCGFVWMFNTTIVEVPNYVNSILKVDIKNNGLLSAAPYVAMTILTIVFSNLFDYLLKRGTLTITAARKISNSIGLWACGAFLIAFSFTPINQLSWATCLLILSVGSMAGINSGGTVSVTDISPNFSGSTVAFSATFGNLIGAIATLVNGCILTDMDDVTQWRLVFGLAAGIAFFTNLIFIIIGTSNVQAWNNPKDPTTEKDGDNI